MATNAPFGLKPVASLNSSNFNEQTNPYPLLSDSSTTNGIFTGDLVEINRAVGKEGYVIRAETSNDTAVLGVFAGCTYKDVNGNIVNSPYWPAAQTTYANEPGTAFIIDDPNVIFMVQTTSATVGATYIDFQQNFQYTAGTGNTANGQSTYVLNLDGLDSPSGTLKILRIAPIPGNVLAERYNKALVIINNHYYKEPTAGA